MRTYAKFEEIDVEILRLLQSAKESVRICVAWISGSIYGHVLRNLVARGISVDIIYNNDNTNSQHGVEICDGIRLYPVNARRGGAYMHNKFCIIDEEILITGSYNWSLNAKNSFENIVVIENDYNLIKYFLHEFYDLINFYQHRSTHATKKCTDCQSHLFRLGVFGSESGKYNESQIDVWEVCSRNHHTFHVGTEYEQFLSSQLGLDNEWDWRNDQDSKDSMLQEFKEERKQIENVQNYFNSQFQNKIHAIGVVGIENFTQHSKWGEDPIYIVKIGWRDMYYRKIIPLKLDDDYYSGVHKIISEHV